MIGPLAAVHVDWSGSVKTGPTQALYFFKKRQYIRWDIEKEQVWSDFPMDIAEGWPGLLDHFPGTDLCGAIHVPGWHNKIWFFFQGQEEVVGWDVKTNKIDETTTPVQTLLPCAASTGGPFAPVYVDRGDSQTVYVFRGDEYTRFTVTDGALPTKSDDGYPRKIGQGWTGGLTVAPLCGVSVNWPNRSSALKNNKLYFFLGDLYTRWDIGTHSNNYRLDIPAGWVGWPQFE
ncbi:MAG: hemopexin repeat-containing protein [Pseudomonadota bacterium]